MGYISHTEVLESEVTLDTSSASEEDFFSTMKPKNYLVCSSEKMDLLHSFPALMKIFIKTTTALSASAAFKRLLCFAGLIFSSKARLRDKKPLKPASGEAQQKVQFLF